MPSLEQLHKVLALDPNDPFVTYGIALEHAKAAQYKTAIEWLDKTLGIDPTYFYAYYQKAKMFIGLGDSKTAGDVLRAGMAIAGKANTGESRHAQSEMQALLETLD
jgi:tetratricopeptide (TPR) repeat protein